jgi:hypothetical protein
MQESRLPLSAFRFPLSAFRLPFTVTSHLMWRISTHARFTVNGQRLHGQRQDEPPTPSTQNQNVSL